MDFSGEKVSIPYHAQLWRRGAIHSDVSSMITAFMLRDLILSMQLTRAPRWCTTPLSKWHPFWMAWNSSSKQIWLPGIGNLGHTL